MMWRSIAAGRSSLPNIRSALNPPLAHCKILTCIPSHFLPNTPLPLNPRFFSQISTNRSDPDFDASIESHIETPILDAGGGASSDSINEFDADRSFDFAASGRTSVSSDSSEIGANPNDGIVWTGEGHEGFDLASSDHAQVRLHNLENGEDQIKGVVWNDGKNENEIDREKLESVLSLLQSSGDGSLAANLEEMGLVLNEEFVLRVIETPLVPGGNLLAFFEWASKQPDFLMTTPMVDALVTAISNDLRKKDAYALWDMIKEIGEREKGILNTEALNKLIALFSKLGKGKAGFEVFNKFEDFGCVPNVETYFFTIEALCRRSFFDWAFSVCEKMLNAGSIPDSKGIGKIISWFCKGKKAKEAHLVYSIAREKNQLPPQPSINFLVSSLSRVDELVHVALEILDDFPSEVRKYAIKPFSSVIRGLCRIKDVKRAKELLGQMTDASPPPGNAVFNLVINGLSKAGDMDEAMALLKLMESRGLKPDVYTYTVLMSGYASGGQMEEACGVLSEAKKKHSKLSPVTYHIIIRGFSKLGEYDKALKFFDEMKSFGVHPNADEYGKLIQSLCLKALDWKTAERLMQEMKENGVHLSGITRGLIRAVKELEEEGTEAGELSVVA